MLIWCFLLGVPGDAPLHPHPTPRRCKPLQRKQSAEARRARTLESVPQDPVTEGHRWRNQVTLESDGQRFGTPRRGTWIFWGRSVPAWCGCSLGNCGLGGALGASAQGWRSRAARTVSRFRPKRGGLARPRAARLPGGRRLEPRSVGRPWLEWATPAAAPGAQPWVLRPGLC